MEIRVPAEAFLPDFEERFAAKKALYESLNIEWCCQGRHGVVRDIHRDDLNKVIEAVNAFMGERSCWVKDTAPRIKAIEFVTMTKVFPGPTKPWEWCGTTVLFEDWKQQEDATRAAAASFTPGQAVWFDHNGVRRDGFISKINRQTIGVTVPGEGEWRIPPTQLNAKEA